MDYGTLKVLVKDKLDDTREGGNAGTVPVTTRLDPETLHSYEVLAKFLGYGGRSPLLRDVLETSLADLMSAALQQSDETTTEVLRDELMSAASGKFWHAQ